MYKAGFLGLIGQPNAGKSTLMNYLVKEKVSIVTAKPQTTRRRIVGISSTEQGQIVFVDAPGLIQADKGLNGFLAKEAQNVIAESDALLAIVSLDEDKAESAEKVIELVAKSGKPWIGIITKTDIKEKQHRLMIIKQMIEAKGVKAISISVKQTVNDDELRQSILTDCLELLPESPAPLYDAELYTDENIRDLVAEAIREKCFEHLHQEVPYLLAVRIIKFDETHEIPKIYAEIIVARENHKPMVIGKGASVIKQIGIDSRQTIEEIMGEKVFLDLKVNVKKDWFDNKIIMKELGYDNGAE